MGYRSRVIISLDKTVIDRIRFIQPEKIPALFKETEYEEGIREGTYFLRWDDIKWYDYYDDTTEVHRFLESLEEDTYRFHRLGEEYGDYETQGDLCDEIYITQIFEI